MLSVVTVESFPEETTFIPLFPIPEDCAAVAAEKEPTDLPGKLACQAVSDPYREKDYQKSTSSVVL